MNTNAKHTPGPWKYRQAYSNGEPCGIVITPMGYDLNTSNPDENEANARLIASSPNLLAALKSAVSYLEANRPKGNIREIFHQLNEYENGVLKPARAALAQAEGGAQ